MTDADDNLRGKDTNNISKVRKNEGCFSTLRCKNFPIPLQCRDATETLYGEEPSFSKPQGQASTPGTCLFD